MITGIILAGGNSSRMGTDKGFTQLKNKHLIEYMIKTLKSVTRDIFIVANSSEYRCFGYTVFSDIIRNCGPLGGIYTGLVHSHTEKNIILSCDMPFITSGLLRYIIRSAGNYEISVPVHNGAIEPLCAVYNKNCAETIKGLLLQRELKITEALKYFNVKMVDISERKFFPDKEFKNINSPNDLLQAEKIFNEN